LPHPPESENIKSLIFPVSGFATILEFSFELPPFVVPTFKLLLVPFVKVTVCPPELSVIVGPEQAKCAPVRVTLCKVSVMFP
jgi:hypothetical protein